MPCGGNRGLLQPVPCGTVLWVAGKLFCTVLMSDFFVQLITLRACLELVGAFFKEKSRFCLLFPLGMSAAGAETGRAELMSLVAASQQQQYPVARGLPGEKAPLFSFSFGFFMIQGWVQLPGQHWGVPDGCGCSGKGTA